MAFVPDLEALRLSDSRGSLPLSKDQRTTIYGNRIRANAFPTQFAVLDPDAALREDPEFYDKVYRELSIAAKLARRCRKTASAGWVITGKGDTPEVQKAKDFLMWAYSHIKDFKRAQFELTYQGVMKGWGLARIDGRYETEQISGDDQERRWWVPTTLSDVSKERMRINERSDLEVAEGYSRYYWAMQDPITQRWHPLDFDGAPPGLRRIDYCWFHSQGAEDDVGYKHGLARYLVTRWYFLTFLWLYAVDAAESWGKGKVVVQSPQAQGGFKGGFPGDLRGGQKSQAQIKEELAAQVARQMARHVLVLSDQENYQVFGQPTSGSEAIMGPLQEAKKEIHEMILGVDYDSDQEIDKSVVDFDMCNLESAMDDLKWATYKWNRHNLLARGIPKWAFKYVTWSKKRDRETTPEQHGKVLMIAAALGAAIHKDDVYEGLGLTYVRPESPDALHLAPPGSPAKGLETGGGMGMPGDPVGAQLSAVNPQTNKGMSPSLPALPSLNMPTSGGPGIS